MDIHAIEKKLTEIAEQFSNIPENPVGRLSGILIGGRNSEGVQSASLYKALKKIYEKLNIEHTAILGCSKPAIVDLYYSTPSDKIITNINPGGCNNPIRTIEDLRGNYDIFEKNPNDEIIFD